MTSYWLSAAILVFRKNKKDNKVLLIDTSREYQDGKNQNQLRPQDLKKVLSAAVDRKNQDKCTYLASVAEIAEPGNSLSTIALKVQKCTPMYLQSPPPRLM